METVKVTYLGIRSAYLERFGLTCKSPEQLSSGARVLYVYVWDGDATASVRRFPMYLRVVPSFLCVGSWPGIFQCAAGSMLHLRLWNEELTLWQPDGTTKQRQMQQMSKNMKRRRQKEHSKHGDKQNKFISITKHAMIHLKYCYGSILLVK